MYKKAYVKLKMEVERKVNKSKKEMSGKVMSII